MQQPLVAILALTASVAAHATTSDWSTAIPVEGQTNRHVRVPNQHDLVDWANGLLAQAKLRPLVPFVQDRGLQRFYRVLRVRDMQAGRKGIEELVVHGVSGIGEDAPLKGVRDESQMRFELSRFETDGKTTTRTMKHGGPLTNEQADRWFKMLYWAEVFNLRADPENSTDNCIFMLPYGGEVWFLERSTSDGYCLIVRNAAFAVCRQLRADINEWLGGMGIGRDDAVVEEDAGDKDTGDREREWGKSAESHDVAGERDRVSSAVKP